MRTKARCWKVGEHCSWSTFDAIEARPESASLALLIPLPLVATIVILSFFLLFELLVSVLLDESVYLLADELALVADCEATTLEAEAEV